jgi:hypothetical protein
MIRRAGWVLVGSALVACGSLAVRAQAPGAPAAPSAPSDGTAAGGPPDAAAPVAPPSNTVKITIITVPQAKKVMVLWGKKRLGIIAPHQPLILQRPRDSGPMDLIVQSEGYVTVQTRAYTFADTKHAVKLTPIDQKKTLLGYRQEVPSPDAGAAPPPDAGAPPAAIAVPSPPSAAPPLAAPPPGAPRAPMPGTR